MLFRHYVNSIWYLVTVDSLWKNYMYHFTRSFLSRFVLIRGIKSGAIVPHLISLLVTWGSLDNQDTDYM